MKDDSKQIEYAPINREELFIILIHLFESRKAMDEVKKVLKVISDSENWGERANTDRAAYFCFMELDPRIMADKALANLREAHDRCEYYLRDVLSHRYNITNGQTPLVEYKKREW